MIIHDKNLKVDAKLKRQERRANMMILWTKNNVLYKSYISYMFFGEI